MFKRSPFWQSFGDNQLGICAEHDDRPNRTNYERRFQWQLSERSPGELECPGDAPRKISRAIKCGRYRHSSKR